eukprot:4712015-Heterocapsa_arctica.AAC.1
MARPTGRRMSPSSGGGSRAVSGPRRPWGLTRRTSIGSSRSASPQWPRRSERCWRRGAGARAGEGAPPA